MIMTVQKYSIDVVYRLAKYLAITDTLSRAFLPKPPDSALEEKFEVNVISTLPISETKLSQLKQNTKADEQLHKLLSVVKSGWPDAKQDLLIECLPYWNYRDEISTSEDILFKGEKVIVPNSMRIEMLKCIHSSHLGTEKCKCRARDILFWPGMNSQIQDVVTNCNIKFCNTYQKRNTKEPLLSHETPLRPWSRVGTDIFELNGQSYLTLVDCYSGFIEVNLIHSTTSKQVITF